MDLKKLLDKLSAEFAIPLRPTERGYELQGSTYYLEYFLEETGRPHLKYVDKTVSFGVVNGKPVSALYSNAAEFEGIADDVMGIFYSIKAPYFIGQFEMLRRTKTKLGNVLLDCFKGAEKLPLTHGEEPNVSFLGGIMHTIIVPDESELFEFIAHHMLFP